MKSRLMQILDPVSKPYGEGFYITFPLNVEISGFSAEGFNFRKKILGQKNKFHEKDMQEGRYVKLRGYVGEFEIMKHEHPIERILCLKLRRNLHPSNYESRIVKIKEFFG